MPKRVRLHVVLLLGLLGLAQTAHAFEKFASLEGDNVGYASYWPKGLSEAVYSHPRVAGDSWSALGFGAGAEGVNLYFKGDQQEFNEFMRQMAKVEGKEVTIHLHTGKAIYGKAGFRPLFVTVKKPLPFDWYVTVFANGLAAHAQSRFKDGPSVELSVNYYLSERGDLMGLDVPRKINVRRGYDSEYLKAHKDDRTVQAIETFIRSREKPRAKSTDLPCSFSRVQSRRQGTTK